MQRYIQKTNEIELRQSVSATLIESKDYRVILEARIKEIKSYKPGFGLVRLCEKLGLHSSYVSAALKGQKSLSVDQLYILAEALGFQDKEIDHLLLLLNYERAQDSKLKNKFLKSIELTQSMSRKSESNLKAKVPEKEDLVLARYYSNPLYKIVHVFLGNEYYRTQINELKNRLSISDEVLEGLLLGLEEMSIIARTPEIKVLKKNYHLPKNFFLCKPHQSMMKTLSLQKQMSLPDQKKETVCVTFSASKEDYLRIHAEFLEFLKRAEGIVKQSPPEEIFQMIFDLHYWS